MEMLSEFDPAWFLVFVATLLSLLAPTRAASPSNSILYVVQVPVPYEQNSDTITDTFTGIAATFGNHKGDTLFCARGGDLMIRYPDGTVSNLTRGAGYGGTGLQGTNAISVRQPAVHWSGTKALFSMVVGSPTNASASTNQNYFWQMYEVTNLLKGQHAVITRLTNQPANYNNISPTYGTDDRVIFTSDRPRDGSPHLYPQLDEYLDAPIVSGLWSLDSASGDLFMIEHTPSGSYTPFIDSAGRLIFVRWDHFSRDRQAVTDGFSGPAQTFNGTFNYSNETADSEYVLTNRDEYYPEPRNFDTNATAAAGVNGNTFNEFFPWEINEDGSAEEIVNHVGRHEFVSFIRSTFTNDPNIFTLNGMTNRFGINTNPVNNIFEVIEDPCSNGAFYGIDCPDFGTHGAGEIIQFNGGTNVNPEQMVIKYLTPRITAGPTNGLPSGQVTAHTGFYRSPCPLSDGLMVCVHTTNKALVVNAGSTTNPRSAFDFRLKLLVTNSSKFFQPLSNLTAGVTSSVSYFANGLQISYTGTLWELDPVEVVARTRPAPRVAAVKSVEQSVFDDEGVDVAAFREYLVSHDLALIVSRNVTTRDRSDKQQPLNLRVPGGVSTIAMNSNTNFTYNIEHFQVFQGDLLRGVTLGGTNPTPGRRVLVTPLHDAANPPDTNSPVPGATRIFPDGSQATFVPARRAVTWNLVGSNTNALFGLVASNAMSVVKERYWLNFAPGEIRSCTSCHGMNVADQAGNTTPTNQPAALRELLRWWKNSAKYSKIVSETSVDPDVSLQISGAPLATNILYASPDLEQWSAVATNDTTTNGLFQLDDLGGATQDRRFYRVLVP